MHDLVNEDYKDWDWLPKAAEAMQSYLERLLAEVAITGHSVTARHKSIESYQDKCSRKNYVEPRHQVQDCVAARVITYSITDRDRVRELIRSRFTLVEDRLPGEEKPERRRGYDCAHLVVSGEKPDAPPGWLVAHGPLARYFDRFSGLEIQVRTVAAHAWAEFEHHVRYKGAEYPQIGDHDQETIDQLFGAASDARRALDETFVAIERVLSNPTSGASGDIDQETFREEGGHTPVDSDALRQLLNDRYPEDVAASPAGLEFAHSIVRACGLDSIEALRNALSSVDGEQVRRLMATTVPVTQVRRLEDELLALYAEQYIHNTSAIGSDRWVEGRTEKLQWRFDRLRRKVHVYEVIGGDCPEELENVRMAATRAVREVVKIIADRRGPDSVIIEDAISLNDDLAESARPRRLELADGRAIWVATNLSREYSEELLQNLFEKASGIDIRVTKSGMDLADSTLKPGTHAQRS